MSRTGAQSAIRIVVIGATGHIGTYLIPRLVAAGHDVVALSRGMREPYQPHEAWSAVERFTIDRSIEETAGTFGQRVASLRPDVVVDLICFTLESARHLVKALEDSDALLLHCGTIWVHGHSTIVPTTESEPREPFGDYGIKKAAIEKWLLSGEARKAIRASIIHPGHIVGPGWRPVNPAGHLDPAVFSKLAKGQELVLPNIGMETLHHVHADDVAQAFELAVAHSDRAVGESFHVCSPAAMTLRGYAESMARHFGQPARLSFLPWNEWRRTVTDEQARITWDHIAHSPNCSITKARERLGYAPRYSSLEAVIEAVEQLNILP
ncbi:MAG TPA: NAD(P)-dependent oxidoreductase [Gemmatimonadaceae bacterium]|nr:NAD(P)-dependent oxidoreductase [Gemmatimonadaceae bacterium]